MEKGKEGKYLENLKSIFRDMELLKRTLPNLDTLCHKLAAADRDQEGRAMIPTVEMIDADIDDHEQPRYTTRRLHEEMKRARAQGRQEVIDELRGTCVAVIPPPPFSVGDQVEKHTGDYHAKGEVRGIFAMKNGAIRYVVEHPAEGGGSFCHIYSEKNLRKVES